MSDVQAKQSERQEKRYLQDQALIEKELSKPVGKDYSGLIKALDAISGEDNFKYYTAPKTQDERDAQVAAMRNKMDQNADKMSASQLNQLGSLLKVQETNSQSKQLDLLYKSALEREKYARTKKDKAEAAKETLSVVKSKFGVDLVNKIEKDSSVKESQKVLDEAGNLRSIVETAKDNPIAAASIPTFMARVAGEVGNLSEADKRPFGGSRAIMERMDAALKQWSEGTLTDDNQKFLIQFLDVLESKRNFLLSKRKRGLVDQYSKGQTMFTKDQLYGIAGVEPAARVDEVASKPAQVEQADWDAATEVEKAALLEHFSK